MNDRAYTRAQRKGLLASTLAQTISATSVLSLPPLASLLQSDFGLTRAELGLLLGAGGAGAVLIAVPAGWLSDLLGVRRVILTGMLVGGLSFCVLSFTGSMPLALLLLLCSGLGTGVIPAATTKAIMYWFSARIRGTAMGIKQTGFPLGGALSAGILPALALALGGWRPAVFTVGLVAIGMCIVYYYLYTEHPHQTFAQPGRPAGFSMLRLVTTDPRILALAVLGFCYGYNLSTLSGYLSLYLQKTLGMEIVLAGAFLMGAQVSGAAGRLALGVISDRFYGGRRAPVLFAVTAFNGVLALGFGWLMPAISAWAQTALILAFGVAAVGWSSLYHVFVGETAGREKSGTAVGLCLMAVAGGNVVGPPVFGFVVDVTQAYPIAWASQGFFAFVGMAIIARLRHEPRLSPASG